MALDLVGFSVSAKLKGSNKGGRTKNWELAADPGAATDDAAFATARTQAVAMIAAFKLLTSSIVLSFQLNGLYEESAAGVPPAGANVYKEAFFTVGLNAAGSKKGNTAIPAPADGVFSGDDPDTGDVDVANPQTLTYLAYFTTPNFFRVSDGEEMLSTPKIQKARIRSVGSGKSY